MRTLLRSLVIPSVMALTSVVAVTIGAPPSYAAPPGNNDFAAATPLSSTASGSTTSNNLDADTETGEPIPPNSGGTYDTLWWSWVAPSTGTYLFDTCGSRLESTLGVYTGSSVDSLTPAGSEFPGECFTGGFWWANEERTLDATAGTTYYLQVGTSNPGSMNDVTLRWWSSATPANDDYAAASLLASTATGSVTGTNRFATNETGEPFLSTSVSGYAVWWKWSPPVDGSYLFDTCGSNFDTTLAVYTGGAVDALTEVVSDDDACRGRQSQVTPFDAVTTETYYLQVRGYGTGSSGDIKLSWHDDTAPANDGFASATPISGSSGTVSGTNRAATTETGEPDTGGHSVWWQWTAPSSGAVIFDTCDSDFEDTLGVYTGTEVSALTSTVQALHNSCMYESTLMFDATAGTAYSIAVGSGGATGDISLNWEMGAAPANDNFADAISLTGAGGTATGTTRFATVESAEPGVADHTVWWKWIAPSNDQVSFDTCGSSMASNLAIYEGSAIDALTQRASGDNNSCGGQAKATFSPHAGTTYYIAVGSTRGSMSDVVLHWPAAGTIGAPTITTHPSDTTVTVGTDASFTAAASGLPVPTVQWQVDDGTGWADLPGQTSLSLYLWSVSYDKNGWQYRAVFTNTEGTATTDAATLTVTPIAATVNWGPDPQSATDGASVSFSANGRGNPAPTVQWQVSTDGGTGWDDVAGGTSDTLTFTATLAMDQYRYRAVFTNPGGTATTDPATLTVYPVPTGDPASAVNATVSKGKITVTFTAGGLPLFTHFECQLTGKGSKGTWQPCLPGGTTFKASATTVNIHGGYMAGGPFTTEVSTAAVARSR